MNPSPSEASAALERVDPKIDHFERLGLPRRFDVARDAIEDAYLDRSKRVHPDRFAGADEVTRRRAQDHASLLNEAYETVRSPLRRAEYLVRLGGIDLDSSDPQTGAPRPDQAFLIDMIERRERLAELAGDDAALEELRDETNDEREVAFDAAIEALEGAPESVKAAAVALVTVRYLDRFLDEIDHAAE